jgi:hypothetical protein
MTDATGQSLQIVVVCEAAADQQTACTLVDRVCIEGNVASHVEELDAKREWRGLDPDAKFVTWIHAKRRFDAEGLHAHGHFEGRPGAPDAHAARRALLLVQYVVPECSAVLLIRDSDNDLRRVEGLA